MISNSGSFGASAGVLSRDRRHASPLLSHHRRDPLNPRSVAPVFAAEMSAAQGRERGGMSYGAVTHPGWHVGCVSAAPQLSSVFAGVVFIGHQATWRRFTASKFVHDNNGKNIINDWNR